MPVFEEAAAGDPPLLARLRPASPVQFGEILFMIHGNLKKEGLAEQERLSSLLAALGLIVINGGRVVEEERLDCVTLWSLFALLRTQGTPRTEAIETVVMTNATGLKKTLHVYGIQVELK